MLPAILFGAAVGIATDKALDLYDDYKVDRKREERERRRRLKE
jgi:hypothetical protein